MNRKPTQPCTCLLCREPDRSARTQPAGTVEQTPFTARLYGMPRGGEMSEAEARQRLSIRDTFRRGTP